jgi:hypothetical protein
MPKIKTKYLPNFGFPSFLGTKYNKNPIPIGIPTNTKINIAMKRNASKFLQFA